MTDEPQVETAPPEDVFTWRQAIQGSNLPIQTRYTGTIFAQYAKSPSEVWVFMDRLIAHVGLSKRRTQDRLRELTDGGWLIETASAHTGRSRRFALRVPVGAVLRPGVNVEVTPDGARYVKPEDAGRVDSSVHPSRVDSSDTSPGRVDSSDTEGWTVSAPKGGQFCLPEAKQKRSEKQSSVFDGDAHTSPPAHGTQAAAAADAAARQATSPAVANLTADPHERLVAVAAATEAGDDTQPTSWSAMTPEQKQQFIAWENKRRGNNPIRQPEGFMRNLTAEERAEKIAQFFDGQKNKPTSLWDQLEETPIEEWQPGYECEAVADRLGIEPCGETWNDLLELFRRKHVKGHAPQLNRLFIEDIQDYYRQQHTNWCPYCGNAKDAPHEFNCPNRDGNPGSARPKYCHSCRTDIWTGTHTTDCATNS